MPIKTYIKLTKPGIIMGNAITAAAGFMLASRNYFNPWLFLAALGGLSLAAAAVVAGAQTPRDGL